MTRNATTYLSAEEREDFWKSLSDVKVGDIIMFIPHVWDENVAWLYMQTFHNFEYNVQLFSMNSIWIFRATEILGKTFPNPPRRSDDYYAIMARRLDPPSPDETVYSIKTTTSFNFMSIFVNGELRYSKHVATPQKESP